MLFDISAFASKTSLSFLLAVAYGYGLGKRRRPGAKLQHCNRTDVTWNLQQNEPANVQPEEWRSKAHWYRAWFDGSSTTTYKYMLVMDPSPSPLAHIEIDEFRPQGEARNLYGNKSELLRSSP